MTEFRRVLFRSDLRQTGVLPLLLLISVWDQLPALVLRLIATQSAPLVAVAIALTQLTQNLLRTAEQSLADGGECEGR